MESSDYLLEVVGVSVDYGHFRALDDVTYRIRRGDIVCLLGGNASGKSTSMKAILGTVRLATGEVRWNGERVNRMPTWQRVKAGMATVPEGRRLFARMTVEENLWLGACNRQDRHAATQDLARLYERFPELATLRRHVAGTLSGGEQQMVAIGRALMSHPALVCMDEPSMGLAPRLVKESFALIRQIRDDGTAVFVVEQNAKAALSVASYAYVLQSGRVVLEGPAQEVADNPMMREAYLGKAAKT